MDVPHMEIAASCHIESTAEEQEVSARDLVLVAEAAAAIIKSRSIDALCRVIANAVHSLAQSSYVVMWLYDRQAGGMRPRALAGFGDDVDTAARLLQRNPHDIIVDPRHVSEEALSRFTSGRLLTMPRGLHAITGGIFSESLCASIEQAFGIQMTYAAGFALDGMPYGGCVIFARQRICCHTAIELLVNHAAVEIRRRQAEKALVESESRYRSIFHSSATPMMLLDPENGAIVDANAASAEFYGYGPEELCRLSVAEISDLPWSEELQDIRSIGKRRNSFYHSQHRRRDGEVREVEVHGNAVMVEGYELIFAIIHDMTERRQAVQTLEQFFSHSSVLICIVDARGKLRRINPAFAEMLGRDGEELPGIPVFDFVHPEDRPETIRAIRRLRRHGAMISVVNKCLTADGEARVLEWTITVDLERELYYGIARDITEQQRVEEQLHQNQKMQAIGQLAGGIAHDFNNILAGIIGYTDITIDFLEPGGRLHDNLKRVLSAAERARCLIGQVLTFSRPAKQGRKPLFLKPLLNEVAGLLRASLPSSIDLVSRLGGERYPVMADASRIQECMMNLAANAAQAMNEKGTLTITLSQEKLDKPLRGKIGVSPPGEYACVTVKDSGCGMSRKLIDRIFEPYFSTSDDSAAGMGLPVVYGIIRSHEGNIVVNSRVGKGSSFLLYIPLCKDAVRNVEADHQVALPQGTENILFVDDEEMLTEAAKELLGGLGYKVTSYRDPVAACRAFEKDPSRFDCMITDLTMPRMNGIELTARVLRARADFPVILCTGYCNQENEKRARRIGIRAFCSKPLSKRELSEVVRQALDDDGGGGKSSKNQASDTR